MQSTKPGEPMFKDLEALGFACNMLGLKLEKKKTYSWWGHSVGDYPIPDGVDVNELGKNAEYVISVTGEKAAQLKKKTGRDPYELGLLADPNNPGCFVPIYDFYAGGYGLSDVVGQVLYGPNKIDGRHNEITALCPLLKQHYDMACDALAAKQAGDVIDFVKMSEAHAKYPQLFPTPSDDEVTWVSVTTTDNRIRE